jgi:hypothetical protein
MLSPATLLPGKKRLPLELLYAFGYPVGVSDVKNGHKKALKVFWFYYSVNSVSSVAKLFCLRISWRKHYGKIRYAARRPQPAPLLFEQSRLSDKQSQTVQGPRQRR